MSSGFKTAASPSNKQLSFQRQRVPQLQRTMENLRSVLSSKQQQRAYLTAVVGYLTKVNSYASQKRSPAMIEYNVGGVISVVGVLKDLAGMKGAGLGDCDDDANELLDLFRQAWFIREDGRPNNTKKYAVYTEFYNSELDMSATLGVAVAQLLVALQADVDVPTATMMRTAASLLRRYSGYLQTGKEHEAVFEDETGDEHMSLARFFRSLYQFTVLRREENVIRGQDLRREGNALFKQGKFGSAVARYTEALLLDPTNYVLLSNRAGAYTYLHDVDASIMDLKKAISIRDDFQPAWVRLGYSQLSKGDALESVKCYVKALSLAQSQRLLDQYIRKMVESLAYAEQRALSQGVSRQELDRLTESVRSMRQNYPPQSAQSQQRTPTPPVHLNESNGTQIPFTFPGMLFTGASQGDTADTQGNFPIFTDPNQNNALREALNHVVGAFGLNIQPIVPSAAAAAAAAATDAQPQPQPQSQPPQQTQTDPQDPIAQQEGHRNSQAIPALQQQSTRSEDQAMAEDPDISIPTDSDVPQQTQSQPGQPASQHTIPQSIQDIFLNSLPNALRNTVSPIIIQSLNNALNAGQTGQGTTYTTVHIPPEQMNNGGHTTVNAAAQSNAQTTSQQGNTTTTWTTRTSSVNPTGSSTASMTSTASSSSPANQNEVTPSASNSSDEHEIPDDIDMALD